VSDVEFARIREGGLQFRQKMELAKHLISCLTCLAALWLIFDGLARIIDKQNPDGLSALAKVIEAVHIGSILGYIFGVGAVAAWHRERNGKKRAIREKSRYQKLAERNDNGRSSSGLNDTGDDPEEDEDE
jgi:hypothetical protein